jgi:hypothetical protein
VAGVVVDRHARETEHEVGLLRVSLDPLLAAAKHRLLLVEIGDLGDAAELPAGLGQDRRLVDVARHRQDHPGGPVVVRHVGHDGLAGDRPDHLGRPQDRAAQGLIGPEDFRGGVVGDTLGFVVVAGDFLEHDAAFPLDLLGREAELSTMSLTISWPMPPVFI